MKREIEKDDLTKTDLLGLNDATHERLPFQMLSGAHTHSMDIQLTNEDRSEIVQPRTVIRNLRHLINDMLAGSLAILFMKLVVFGK